MTRLQAVGFVGVLVAALALYAFSERSAASVRRMLPTLCLVGAAAVAWATVRVALGGVGELLGAYAPLTEAGSYSVVDIGRSIAWHTGALALLTIAIPLVALGVLAWETLRAHETDAGRSCARGYGSRVSRGHRGRGERIRVAIRRPRDGASASLGCASCVRRLCRVARTEGFHDRSRRRRSSRSPWRLPRSCSRSIA